MSEFYETRHPLYDTKYHTEKVLSDLKWSLSKLNDDRLTDTDDVIKAVSSITNISQWLLEFDRSVQQLKKLYSTAII